MKKFIHAPSREWRLSGSAAKLVSPGYETIVRRLAVEAVVIAHRRERAKRRRKYFRANIELRCRRETLSLFHSGRSGYRAQFYSSIRRGEIANQYAVSALVPRIRQLLEGKEKRGCSWSWIEKSLRDPSAKLWIHQGSWLRANARKHRNLYVERWFAAQTSRSKKRSKKARWSALTPSHETVLELKGGFVSLAGIPLGSLKEDRSRDLHELGFT